MFPRRGSAWTEEGVEAKVEAVMLSGGMDVEAVCAMLMNWTPTTVVELIKTTCKDKDKDKDKDKGAERDTSAIRVTAMAPESAVVLITWV